MEKKNNHKIGVFPGSFDPFTLGHEAIVRKALTLFDEIIIGIGINQNKQYLFDLEKRKKHIASLFTNDNVQIQTYTGLTIEFCKTVGAQHIIRGLRDVKDFDYEKSIAQMNLMLAPIETVFILTDLKYSAINATIVREIYKSKGDISSFVSNSHLLI
jgi:pantetheine-phosphate adenylyltransferase